MPSHNINDAGTVQLSTRGKIECQRHILPVTLER